MSGEEIISSLLEKGTFLLSNVDSDPLLPVLIMHAILEHGKPVCLYLTQAVK